MPLASKTRLYYPPNHTVETLQAIISGSQTPEEIADDLGISVRTVKNKLHDPLHLNLIEENDRKYEATEEARRLVQLQDDDVLKERFVDLPGVPDVLDKIEDGGVTVEEIGRIVSFETESGAADVETFEKYGRVYARWIENFELGEVETDGSSSHHPLENDQGANNPSVRPQKLIDALRVIDEVNTAEELADRLGYSESESRKILTTGYGLGVARPDRGNGFTTTDIGRTVTTTSEGKQRELLRDQLLEIPFVQAYCNNVPDGEFKNRDVIEEVSEEYNLGWSDGTIETKAKRLYRWLIFTQLAEEEKRGILEATEKMPRGNLPKP